MLGQYTWSSQLNANSDNAKDIKLDATGNIYVCGLTYSGDYSYSTIKLNPSLNFVWEYTYHGGSHNYGYPNHMAVDSNNNVYMTGQFRNVSIPSDDGALIKIDSNGVQKWVRTYNGQHNGNDYYYDMTIDNAGNPIVCGVEDQSLTENSLTIKYDSSGTIVFADTYLNTANVFQTDRTITTNNVGEILVCGESFSSGQSSVLTIKYSPTGNIIWDHTYIKNSNLYNKPVDNFTNDNGDLFITGYTMGTDYDALTLVYDNMGNVILDTTFSGVGYDAGNSIISDQIGNIYVLGVSYYDAIRDNDLLVIKYSPITLDVAQNETSTFKMCPNPTNDKTTINYFKDSFENVKITVTDIQGRTVSNSEIQNQNIGNNKFELNTDNLKTGFYFVTLRTGIQTTTQKLIVVH